MEIVAIVGFVVLVIGMVFFVRYKNKKAAEERAVRNAAGLRQMEAEWAVSEYNPDSPNFNKAKYDEMVKSLKELGLAL